jgi:hypothetical protein
MKRPLGDITNLKRDVGSDTSKLDLTKSKSGGSLVSSMKATDLIRRSLAGQQSIQWKPKQAKVHIQGQTDMVHTKTHEESSPDAQKHLYDWEMETVDEVKTALREALKENETVGWISW